MAKRKISITTAVVALVIIGIALTLTTFAALIHIYNFVFHRYSDHISKLRRVL